MLNTDRVFASRIVLHQSYTCQSQATLHKHRPRCLGSYKNEITLGRDIVITHAVRRSRALRLLEKEAEGVIVHGFTIRTGSGNPRLKRPFHG